MLIFSAFLLDLGQRFSFHIANAKDGFNQNRMNKELIRNKMAFLGSELVDTMIASGVYYEVKKGQEILHQGQYVKVNSLVTNFQAALFRDFPDDVRVHGDERF